MWQHLLKMKCIPCWYYSKYGMKEDLLLDGISPLLKSIHVYKSIRIFYCNSLACILIHRLRRTVLNHTTIIPKRKFENCDKTFFMISHKTVLKNTISFGEASTRWWACGTDILVAAKWGGAWGKAAPSPFLRYRTEFPYFLMWYWDIGP